MASFPNFMATVDSYLEEWVGIGSDCLPDVDYWAMFDQGMKPKNAAVMAIVAQDSYNEHDPAVTAILEMIL